MDYFLSRFLYKVNCKFLLQKDMKKIVRIKQFLRHNEEKVTLNDYYSTVKQIDTNDNKG